MYRITVQLRTIDIISNFILQLKPFIRKLYDNNLKRQGNELYACQSNPQMLSYCLEEIFRNNIILHQAKPFANRFALSMEVKIMIAKTTIKERIKEFRQFLQKHGIDYFIVTDSDFHNSEYVGEHFKFRTYLSGFTGSNGTLLVSAEEAILWTDGRYFLQAEDQLADTGIELYRSGNEGVPSLLRYLQDKIRLSTDKSRRPVLGFDGRIMEQTPGLLLAKENCDIVYDIYPSECLWPDRPAIVSNPVYILDTCYAGQPAADKLAAVREAMKKAGCEYHLLSSLDDIAWLLNLRGSDIPCNPVFLSHFLMDSRTGILFCNPDSISEEVNEYLMNLGIYVQPYDSVYDVCRELPVSDTVRILTDSSNINYALYKILSNKTAPVSLANPTIDLKAIKNSIEIGNLRKANVQDGVAMVRFLAWLDRTADTPASEQLTELSIAQKLLEFRQKGTSFKDLSFETIAAYGPHAAIVHYEPTAETDIPVQKEGFLLIDSGAQYSEGTTDITRTIAMGPLSEEMKAHYTAVLKGNLDLAAARFTAGSAGANLDVLARLPLWNLGLDFNHGTGHGIGYFLNVHEGPHTIHWRLGTRKSNQVPLRPGMLMSDEPGVYISGSHGIRIENDILVTEDTSNEFGTFYRFEVMTLCPIDLKPVIPERLTEAEKEQLNSYHRKVYETLSPYLEDTDKNWLESACAPL